MQRKRRQFKPATLRLSVNVDDEKSRFSCKTLAIWIFIMPSLIIIGTFSLISHVDDLVDNRAAVEEKNICPKRGFVTCASNHLLLKVETLRKYMRDHLKDSLVIQVFHTGEIDENLQDLYPYLQFVDLRYHLRAVGIDKSRDYYFRSFQCKPMALAFTCLEQALFFDVDIVPIQSLSSLFESPLFQHTGTLFFRDQRLGEGLKYHRNVNYMQTIVRELWQDRHGRGSELGKVLLRSALFQNVSTDSQESSIVVIDRKRNSRLIDTMIWLYQSDLRIRKLSGDFSLDEKTGRWRWVDGTGTFHGDKEMFWLSAALADLNHSFSPWGYNNVHKNCGSIQGHYHPDATLSKEKLTPLLFLNGVHHWHQVTPARTSWISCPAYFDKTLEFGKRCSTRCGILEEDYKAILAYKYYGCKSWWVTSWMCWLIPLGYNLNILWYIY